MGAETRWVHTPPRFSATFDEYSIAEIHRAAATGNYDIHDFLPSGSAGAPRSKKPATARSVG